MDGRDVSNRMVRELLRTACRRGYEEEKLLAGLSFTSARVQDVRAFVAWDDYVILLDRLQEAAGGPEGMEDLAADMIVSAPITQLLARQFVSPSQLYTVLAQRLSNRMYTMVGQRYDLLPDGRIRNQMRIPKKYRGSTAFHHGSIGCYRAYPVLLGLPPALVEASITTHEAVVFVTPPQSQTLASRALRAISPVFSNILKRRSAPMEADTIEVVEIMDEVGRDASTIALGRRMAAQSNLAALVSETVAVFRDQHLCTFVRLFVRREQQRPLELIGSLGAHEPVMRSARVLTVGDQELGRLEIDLDLDTNGMAAPWIEAMLPWLALGLENCLRAERGTASGKATTGDVVALAQRAAARWLLTRREAEVLELLATGASNREIAAGLRFTLRTAEAHVAKILVKTGAQSRAEVVSLLLRAA